MIVTVFSVPSDRVWHHVVTFDNVPVISLDKTADYDNLRYILIECLAKTRRYEEEKSRFTDIGSSFIDNQRVITDNLSQILDYIENQIENNAYGECFPLEIK